MQHIKGRTKFDCMICSVAMAFDKSYEEVMELFPNFLEKDDTNIFGIRGADTDEIVRVIYLAFGYKYICYSGTIDISSYVEGISAPCLVMKILPGGTAHMAACKFGVVYDPASEEVSLISDWAPTHIWRFVKTPN